MTVADLAKGDTVIKQVLSTTVGTSFGNTDSYADSGTGLDCNVQSMSISESLKYSTRGELKIYNVFFATDPGLTKQNRLKWTKTEGNNKTFDTPLYLRVLAAEHEQNPDGSVLLYNFVCSLETTRGNP